MQVPDGCVPGQALLVDVPEATGSGESSSTAVGDDGSVGCEQQEGMEAALLREQLDEAPGSWSCTACTYLNAAHRLSCDMCGTPREPGGEDADRSLREQSDAQLARQLQGEEVRASAEVGTHGDNNPWSSISCHGSCASSDTLTAGNSVSGGSGNGGGGQSLFAMSIGTEDGTFGNPVGDFYVGQLVQVTRSDGSWYVLLAFELATARSRARTPALGVSLPLTRASQGDS